MADVEMVEENTVPSSQLAQPVPFMPTTQPVSEAAADSQPTSELPSAEVGPDAPTQSLEPHAEEQVQETGSLQATWVADQTQGVSQEGVREDAVNLFGEKDMECEALAVQDEPPSDLEDCTVECRRCGVFTPVLDTIQRNPGERWCKCCNAL